jgi:hypothetical protein
LLHGKNVRIEEPADSSSVGVFPHVYTLFSGHLAALIKLMVALKAKSGNAVVIGFEPSALAVS